MDDFIPSEFLRRISRWWWLFALIMIAGGAAGILAARLQKPVYESQASITTSIDFAYANRITEDEEDYMISTVGDVIDSSQVLDRVKQKAADNGMTLTDQYIRTRFTKARQGYRWELTVRSSTPAEAQSLTQIWVDSAGEGLAVFRERSLNSLKYHSAEIALENCFSQMVVIEPASAYCSLENLSDIRNALDETSPQETLYSASESILLSKISTEISDNAYLPVSPIVYKQNLMAIAGVFCGFLIAFGIFLFGKFK